MRHAWFALLLASAGCNSILGIEDLSVASDGGVGTPDGVLPDAPPNYDCHGTLVAACFPPPAPTNTLDLSGTFNTSGDSRCVPIMQSTNVEVCAVYAGSITIGATLEVDGTRPLMLVAVTTITVGNAIEVGSIESGRIGPGANASACLAPDPGTNSMNDGGGGGAGGTFGSVGGGGGKGAGGGGGVGANPRGVSVPAYVGLRGGCAGSSGGRGEQAQANQVGAGGAGGGAVYLYAGVAITISQRINASGAGGSGATGGRSGGGGAGTGGMIVLEAPMITIEGTNAEVFANGGGGGEGTRNTAADNGGESTAFDSGGSSGTGQSNEGGAGGVGADLNIAAGTGVNGTGGPGNEGGGGGGGGGLGVILYKGTLMGAEMNQISPAPQQLQ